MFEVYNLSTPEILGFVLVLIRISAFIVTMPLIGAENVPHHLKVLFSLAFALLLFPTLHITKAGMMDFEPDIIWLAMREATVGVILGFISRLFFFALTVSGEVLSLSIGLSSEQLFNPATGGRNSALQQFQVMLGSLLFLGINGHHHLITGMVQSFELLPISREGLNAIPGVTLVGLVQEIIWLGIKMSAPVMIAIFFMNIIMGVLGRAVPQINVLVTSLPVNVFVGFSVLLISIPLLVTHLEVASATTINRLFQILKVL